MSLDSAYQMPVAPPSLRCDNQTCLQSICQVKYSLAARSEITPVEEPLPSRKGYLKIGAFKARIGVVILK